eukprot:746164-Pleurochrysis_carterae.AAC.1
MLRDRLHVIVVAKLFELSLVRDQSAVVHLSKKKLVDRPGGPPGRTTSLNSLPSFPLPLLLRADSKRMGRERSKKNICIYTL